MRVGTLSNFEEKVIDLEIYTDGNVNLVLEETIICWMDRTNSQRNLLSL